MSTLPPIDPAKFDAFLRANYFKFQGTTTTVLDATAFFTAFQGVETQLYAGAPAVGAVTRQLYSGGINPLDRLLTWSGFQAPAPTGDTYDLLGPDPSREAELDQTITEAKEAPVNDSGLFKWAAGDPTLYPATARLRLVSVSPRSDNSDATRLLLECKMEAKPLGTVVDAGGSITVVTAPSAVTTITGFMELRSIPALVYFQYTVGTEPLFAGLDSARGVLTYDVRPDPAQPPLAARSWVGIRPELDPATDRRSWSQVGFVYHVPFQRTLASPPLAPWAESRLTFDTNELPPGFFELTLFNDKDVAVAGPQRFHSRQDTNPRNFDPARPIRNSVPHLAVDVGAPTSTETTITARISYARTPNRDTVVVRELGVPDTTLAWAYVSHVAGDPHTYKPPATPPAPGATTSVTLSSLDGLDAQLRPYGLSPGYYQLDHLDGDGEQLAGPAEFYSALVNNAGVLLTS